MVAGETFFQFFSATRFLFFHYIICFKKSTLENQPKKARVEVLDLCFDFDSRASVVLRLKFCGRKAVLS